jgi:hypothetical protein
MAVGSNAHLPRTMDEKYSGFARKCDINAPWQPDTNKKLACKKYFAF